MAVLNKKYGIHGNAVYIGRGSRWGNPFIIGQHGDRDEVCEKYRVHLWNQIKSGEVSLFDLAALHGKDLVCYCAPLRCHGHTLESAAAWAHSQLPKPTDVGYDYSEVGYGQFRLESRIGDKCLEHFRNHLSDMGILIVSVHSAGNGVYEIDTDTLDD